MSFSGGEYGHVFLACSIEMTCSVAGVEESISLVSERGNLHNE